MSLNIAKQSTKILCIGRNYAAHITELNNTKPAQPFYFLKPSSAILEPNSGPILIPKGTTVHYEVELAVVLGKTIKNYVPETNPTKDSMKEYIAGYALAIDLTARNVQDEAKKKGLPWSIAKGFDTFLPLSKFIPKNKIPDPYKAELHLEVNGETKQKDLVDLMIFPIHEILATMSSVMTLNEGDIILTGTPKGVGPIVAGDRVTAGIRYNDQDIEEAKLDLEVEDKPGPYSYKET